MVYISNLKPRKNNLIFNNYFIVNNFQIDFHIVIYYLTKNKCKIILRRLDKEEGWYKSDRDSRPRRRARHSGICCSQ